MDLSNIQSVKALLHSQSLKVKKFLGQNFLVNEDSLNAIVETAKLEKSDHIVEVGPGLGVLTHQLLEKTAKVTTVELDPAMAKLLPTTFKDYSNLEIINADALQVEPPTTPYKVVANIPYNITSPLINHFLRAKNPPISLTLLVQKEVAEKLCTCEPDMTILSLQVNLFGQPTFIKKVPSAHFHPSPKVDSAIIHIETYTPADPRYLTTEAALKILKKAKMAFSQRRKKILNTLNLRDRTAELEEIGIDPNRRPETLSIKEWQKLLPILG